MAYNIASMVEILEQDQHHLHLACKNQIDNFLEKARSFRDVILRIPCYAGHEMDDEFTGKAHAAEDFIEAHIRNQILLLPGEDDDEFGSQLDVLTNLVQEYESVIEKALETVNYDDPELRQPSLPVEHLTSEQVPWYPKIDPFTRNDIPAIFEDDFQTLKARIIEGPSKLRIISIHGEPGMGKSTLARRLYNDPLIATKFHIRVWISSPTEINEKSCLLNLIEGLGKLTNDMHRKNVDELKLYIRNTLQDIKYFIVIHDVFGNQNFVTFARLFRNHRAGARVLFTTVRIDEEILSTYTEPYHMPLLTDDESWLLLCHKVFGREHCPDALELIGKNIMQLCKGSPQAVSLAAGVLATSEKTPATWELVATTMGSESLNTEEMLPYLFSMIYYHMPHYLRPCLLYTGAFYELRDIKASRIIKLWIAEGFIKQSKGECLEDVAETYLGILIDKNLLSLTHQEPNGKIKAFRHQLFLKIICWLQAYEENFLGSTSIGAIESKNEEAREAKLARRVSAHGLSELSNEMELPPLARSFLSMTGILGLKFSVFLKLTLLRVIDVFQMEFYQFPMEIMQQVLLRYLAFSCHSFLSNSFSILSNLQTIIIRRLPAFRAFSLPSDLWELTQLRHVKCKETFLLCYSRNRKAIVHENLQTLSNMQLLGVTNQFLGMIPNIKNLGIYCNIAMETVFDLAYVDKLEKLKCSSDWSLASRNFLSFLTLPPSLRKLTLNLCRIPSEFMKLVGSLPNLELLKLQKCDFFGAQNKPEWETSEGEFPQLLSLEMLDLNVVHWRAKATHLPRLKHLVIRNCYAMVEVPLEIGNIPSLELIQVNETSPFVLVSAMQIKKIQEGLGNHFLQIRTHDMI